MAGVLWQSLLWCERYQEIPWNSFWSRAWKILARFSHSFTNTSFETMPVEWISTKCNQFQQIYYKIYLSNRLSCSPLCQCNEGLTFNWFILLFLTLLRFHQQPGYIFSVFKPNTSQNSSIRPDEDLNQSWLSLMLWQLSFTTCIYLFSFLLTGHSDHQRFYFLHHLTIYLVDENDVAIRLIHFSFEISCCNKLYHSSCNHFWTSFFKY